MKWKRIHVLMFFTCSLGLYILADLSLYEMLGRHPLQSEITMIDRHLYDVEKEQFKVKELSKKEKDGLGEEESSSLRKNLVYGALGGTVLMLPLLLIYFLRRRKRGEEEVPAEQFATVESKPFSFPHPDWRFVFIMVSLLLVGAGGLYIREGHLGQRQLSSVVLEIELREKQRRVRDEKERVKEEVIRGMMTRDIERKQKGVTFLVLGVLLLLGTSLSGLGRRPPV